MAPPRFVKFLGIDTAIEDGVCLKFQGSDGNGYTAIVDPSAVPATIAALIMRGGQLGAGHPACKGDPAVAQPLIPTGFHIGAAQAGNPVIFFQFGEAGALPIQLTRRQLKDVKRLVGKLDQLSTPASGKARH